MTFCPPEIGSIWAGGGMTVRVLEVLGDDVRVLILTGGGRLLKRPRQTGVITGSAFDSRMRKSKLPGD